MGMGTNQHPCLHPCSRTEKGNRKSWEWEGCSFCSKLLVMPNRSQQPHGSICTDRKPYLSIPSWEQLLFCLVGLRLVGVFLFGLVWSFLIQNFLHVLHVKGGYRSINLMKIRLWQFNQDSCQEQQQNVEWGCDIWIHEAFSTQVNSSSVNHCWQIISGIACAEIWCIKLKTVA